MFEEEAHWNVDKKTDDLNRSLFGEVQFTAGAKKKQRKMKEKGNHNVSEQSGPSMLKENKHRRNKKLNAIGVRNGNKDAKKEKKHNISCSGSKAMNEGKKKKRDRNAGNMSEIRTSNAMNLDLKESKLEQGRLAVAKECGDTPKNKRKKHRKRKPKNKYAHLAKKKEEVNVLDPKKSDTDGIKYSGSEGRSSVVGDTKTKCINKRKRLENESGMDIGSAEFKEHGSVWGESGEIQVQKKKCNSKKRTHRNDSNNLEVHSKSKKLKVSSSDRGDQDTKTGSSNLSNRKVKKNSTGNMSSSSLNIAHSVLEKKVTLSTRSPFDVTELKKRLSVGGAAGGTEVPQGSAKDDGSSTGSLLKEGQKKGPQTLREKMMERLNAARFRAINEQLYTCTGAEAYDLFQDDPSTFSVYHEGFQNQVSKWPVNPLDKMISYIRSKSSKLIVADFGCGDAKIAQSVTNKVHSFDLVAVNEHITACDMSKVPLKNNCVDIGIFCLSLMGTNLIDYLHEANRVMKKGGILLVAEVVSRIERLNIFIHQVEDLGFMLTQKDKSNKMFILFEFKKAKDAPPKNSLSPITLLPCVYKKR